MPPYVEPGYTATDAEDGDLTSQVSVAFFKNDGGSLVPVSSINTAEIGGYQVNYSVVDSQNNTTVESRIVNVVANPNTIPVISLLGNSPDSITVNQEYGYEIWEDQALAPLTMGPSLYKVSPAGSGVQASGIFNTTKGITIEEFTNEVISQIDPTSYTSTYVPHYPIQAFGVAANWNHIGNWTTDITASIYDGQPLGTQQDIRWGEPNGAYWGWSWASLSMRKVYEENPWVVNESAFVAAGHTLPQTILDTVYPSINQAGSEIAAFLGKEFATSHGQHGDLYLYDPSSATTESIIVDALFTGNRIEQGDQIKVELTGANSNEAYLGNLAMVGASFATGGTNPTGYRSISSIISQTSHGGSSPITLFSGVTGGQSSNSWSTDSGTAEAIITASGPVSYIRLQEALDTNNGGAVKVSVSKDGGSSWTTVLNRELTSVNEIYALTPSYQDPGATATDAEDGDLTAGVVVTGTVDTSTVGTYILTYSVIDSYDSTATATRTVDVVAPASPLQSVIFDIADNWGDNSFLGIRSIEFKLNGVLVPSTEFSADATSHFTGVNAPIHAFTGPSKIGDEKGWLAGSNIIQNQRIVVNFPSTLQYDEIVINNQHFFGADLDWGARNIVITSSTDEITDMTYGASITNSTQLFSGELAQHTPFDAADDQTIWPIAPAPSFRSVIFDIADNWGNSSTLGIRLIEFKLNGVLIPHTGFSADATSQYGSGSAPLLTFTNSSKIGSQNSWSAAANTVTNQRLRVTFPSTLQFDEIVINNEHTYGGDTDWGARNIVITGSTDAITSTTYGASIANSTELFDGELAQHVASDLADDQVIWTA